MKRRASAAGGAGARPVSSPNKSIKTSAASPTKQPATIPTPATSIHTPATTTTNIDHAAPRLNLLTPALKWNFPLIKAPVVTVRNGRVHDAVQRGNMAALMAEVMACHDSVNARGSRLRTPLILASRWGRTDMQKYLLNNGAVLGDADDVLKTALHWAAEYGRAEAVRTLLARGADPDVQDFQGQTAMHHATFHCQAEVVEVRRKREHLTCMSHIPATPPPPLHCRGRSWAELSCLSAAASTTTTTLPQPPPPRHHTYTCIHTQLLLSNGASPTITDVNGRTARDLLNQRVSPPSTITTQMHDSLLRAEQQQQQQPQQEQVVVVLGVVEQKEEVEVEEDDWSAVLSGRAKVDMGVVMKVGGEWGCDAARPIGVMSS